MDTKKLLRKTALLSIIWMLIAVLILTGATYAWFTFSTWLTVHTLSSTISGGGIELYISNSPDGPFATTCELILSNNTELLTPFSTGDLSSFYIPTYQDKNGVPKAYKNVTGSFDTNCLHGFVYLQCRESGCRVYFNKEGLSVGDDIQALAAMRLGLRIKTQSGTKQYIFKLDDIADTSSAASMLTVETANTVYAGSYISDPSVQLSDYFSQGTKENPLPGAAELCILNVDEVASVEYWLYIEGCDENCINEVQSKDLDLALAFTGVER